MFELTTERLRIIRLDVENLKLFVTDKNKLAENMGFSICDYKLDEDFRLALKKYSEYPFENADDFQWYTAWLLVIEATSEIIGSAGFKYRPSVTKEVEIGYGLDNEKYYGKGFMTEALRCICRWAFEQGTVEVILAETEIGNLRSEKVLKKSSFTFCYQKEDYNYWKLDK